MDFAYNQYGTGLGAAYYETVGTNNLLCVSPGNTFDRGVVPQARRARSRTSRRRNPGFFQHLNFNFSIGQAF